MDCVLSVAVVTVINLLGLHPRIDSMLFIEEAQGLTFPNALVDVRITNDEMTSDCILCTRSRTQEGAWQPIARFDSRMKAKAFIQQFLNDQISWTVEGSTSGL